MDDTENDVRQCECGGIWYVDAWVGDVHLVNCHSKGDPECALAKAFTGPDAVCWPTP